MSARPQTPLAALRDDRGGMTAWMLLWVVGIMAMGGFAVDTSKAWRMKTMLRAAADASSHAAIQAAVNGEDPVAAARRYVELNLPPELMGDVLSDADVEMGAWDSATGDFVADEASSDAVRVTVYRSARNANAEPTTLLKIIGIDSWDLSTRSVASTYDAFVTDPDMGDTCLTKGIVSRGTVSVTSNNTFSDVCVHGEEGFTFNNNNVYEAGTQISMPQLYPMLNHAKPYSTKQNTGIGAALVETSIDPVLADKTDALTLYFALGAEVTTIENYDQSLVIDGDHLYVHCAAAGTLSLPTGRIEDLILTTNCAVDFAGGTEFINAVIATSMNAGGDDEAFDDFADQSVMTAAMARALLDAGLAADEADPTMNDGVAITGASDVALGLSDSCTDGGGSLLVADGDVKVAAKMGIFGSTMIASGDIQMAAQAAGVEGMAIQAGGDVDLPAEQTYIGCNGTDWRIAVKQKVRFLN
jgi:hypothetical protein